MPNRYPGIELATRIVMKNLGIELVDMEGASCCPAPGAFGPADLFTWRVLGARNLSIAEKKGVDVLTVCNGCYKTLYEVNQDLINDPELRERVNEILRPLGYEYNGTIRVRHIAEYLHRDYGVEKLREAVKKPLKGIKVAVHYGCHLMRPKLRRELGDSERPHLLEDIIEATGAECVEYKDMMICCGAGGGVRSYDLALSLTLTHTKIKNATEAGADCMVNVCPFCHLQLDRGQAELKEQWGVYYGLPILHYSQLLGLAMGINPRMLGFEAHYVPVDSFLEKLKGII